MITNRIEGCKPLCDVFCQHDLPMRFKQHLRGNTQRKGLPGCLQIKFNKRKGRAHVLFLCQFVKSNLHAALFAKLGRGTATFTWRILCPKKWVSAIFRILLKVELVFFLVSGALIIAIIQSFRAKMPVGEAAGHPLILLEPLSTARTLAKRTGVLTKCCDRRSLFDI